MSCLSIFWRFRRMRRHYISFFAVLTLSFYIFIFHSIPKFPRKQSQKEHGGEVKIDIQPLAVPNENSNLEVQDKPKLSQSPTLSPNIWQSVWPSGVIHSNYCFNKRWNTFILGLVSNNVNRTINKKDLIGKLTAEDRDIIEQRVNSMQKPKLGKVCTRFLEAGLMRRPTVTHVINSTSSSSETVTFVTQLGRERFDRLQLVLDNWNAAVSATVYVRRVDVPRFINQLCECKQLQNRSNVDIHIVLVDGNYYPMNYLRNVALKGSKTLLSYLSDVDFIPNYGVENVMKDLWRTNSSFFDKNVLIIPAFEILAENYETPKSKQDVIAMWDDKKLIPAREQKWPAGHMPTNYPKWKGTSDIYPVRFSESFEPYIVMKTSLIPQYSEEFVERYRDKAQHLSEVWAMGFHYNVLGSSYAIHYPHSRSKSSTSDVLYRCALETNSRFVTELRKKYKFKEIPTYHPS